MYNVYLYYSVNKPYLSPALKRIEDGLKSTLPENYSFTNDYRKADYIIQPVVNWKDVNNLTENAIILQLCHITAGEKPDFWQYVWRKAKFVVSYLNLPYDNYLRIPLGYDPTLFYPDPNVKKEYNALVTGFVDHKRGEYIKGVHKVFGNVVHVGENFKLGKGYNHFVNVSDAKLRELYQKSKYVVALRQFEGFELPIIEGAACGASPVYLDMECYKHWYGGFGHAVNPDDIYNGLLKIKNKPYTPFVRDMKDFHWQTVLKPFWEKVK